MYMQRECSMYCSTHLQIMCIVHNRVELKWTICLDKLNNWKVKSMYISSPASYRWSVMFEQWSHMLIDKILYTWWFDHVTVLSRDYHYHNYIMPTNACNDNCCEYNYAYGYFPQILEHTVYHEFVVKPIANLSFQWCSACRNIDQM